MGFHSQVEGKEDKTDSQACTVQKSTTVMTIENNGQRGQRMKTIPYHVPQAG